MKMKTFSFGINFTVSPLGIDKIRLQTALARGFSFDQLKNTEWKEQTFNGRKSFLLFKTVKDSRTFVFQIFSHPTGMTQTGGIGYVLKVSFNPSYWKRQEATQNLSSLQNYELGNSTNIRHALRDLEEILKGKDLSFLRSALNENLSPYELVMSRLDLTRDTTLHRSNGNWLIGAEGDGEFVLSCGIIESLLTAKASANRTDSAHLNQWRHHDARDFFNKTLIIMNSCPIWREIWKEKRLKKTLWMVEKRITNSALLTDLVGDFRQAANEWQIECLKNSVPKKQTFQTVKRLHRACGSMQTYIRNIEAGKTIWRNPNQAPVTLFKSSTQQRCLSIYAKIRLQPLSNSPAGKKKAKRTPLPTNSKIAASPLRTELRFLKKPQLENNLGCKNPTMEFFLRELDKSEKWHRSGHCGKPPLLDDLLNQRLKELLPNKAKVLSQAQLKKREVPESLVVFIKDLQAYTGFKGQPLIVGTNFTDCLISDLGEELQAALYVLGVAKFYEILGKYRAKTKTEAKSEERLRAVVNSLIHHSSFRLYAEEKPVGSDLVITQNPFPKTESWKSIVPDGVSKAEIRRVWIEALCVGD